MHLDRRRTSSVRDVLLAGLAVLLSTGCARREERREPAPPARNLVLISIDTLRADHLGCYGYERDTSPRIDALAAQGTLFETALSPASWTVPAHASMLTGQGVLTHGMLAYDRPGMLAPETVPLAEILRDAGFRTAAFTGGGFVSRLHGFARGFEVFASAAERKMRFHLPSAIRWVEELPKEERFFLFVHGFDVHGPYEPAPSLDRLFAGDYAGDYDVRDFEPRAPRPSDDDLAFVVAQYDACIRTADRQVRKLLSALARAGRLEETLVVITSDHGEEMYEHGSIEHTHQLYEELVRVPLVLVGPGVPACRDPRPAGLIDLVPTVLPLLGLPPPSGLDGRDLFAPDREARPYFAHVDTTHYPYRLSSVRTERWKLVRWELAAMRDLVPEPQHRYAPRLFVQPARDRVELFDLAADPGERRDVASRHPDVVARLLGLLEEREREVAARAATPLPEDPADEQYLRDLEALGYGR